MNFVPMKQQPNNPANRCGKEQKKQKNQLFVFILSVYFLYNMRFMGAIRTATIFVTG